MCETSTWWHPKRFSLTEPQNEPSDTQFINEQLRESIKNLCYLSQKIVRKVRKFKMKKYFQKNKSLGGEAELAKTGRHSTT